MPDRLIRDEIVTMLWAGHETTYNALEWGWFLLSQNPSVEDRLVGELLQVLEDGPLRAEHLQRLSYTDMVFSEILRLYPPAWVLARWALDDDLLDSGLKIPKSTQIIIIPYVVHRDPVFFPDPERFDPCRFSPERKARRPAFAYFPFGGGQRVCIGEHFGRMEGVLVLATIARRYKLSVVPGQCVTPDPLLTLRPRQDILMQVTPRKGAST
jgi:cytochrome P450